MTTFRTRAFLNETGHRFEGYEPGDTLANPDGLTFAVSVDGDDKVAALEQVFAIGNTAQPDVNGKTWPRQQRSLSVGDVVALLVDDDHQTFYAVDVLGFTLIEDPCDCGKGAYCPQYGIAFGPRAIEIERLRSVEKAARAWAALCNDHDLNERGQSLMADLRLALDGVLS